LQKRRSQGRRLHSFTREGKKGILFLGGKAETPLSNTGELNQGTSSEGKGGDYLEEEEGFEQFPPAKAKGCGLKKVERGENDLLKKSKGILKED